MASLKDYLKKYTDPSSEYQGKKKTKKKKKEKPKPNFGSGVIVVDEDPVWQKPILEEEEEESAEDEAPQVDEDIEVKRMKRLEAIRNRKPYNAISEDGSGWVSVSKDSDLSPPRQRRPRCDTPSPKREQEDLSPPRQRRRRLDTPEAETEPKDGDGNFSPPQRIRNRADADLSPPRRNRSVEDLSPPRRSKNRSSEVDPDLSPPRRSRNRTEDLSPPRRKVNEDLSPPRKKREQSVAKEARRTGLLSAEEIRKENDKKRKDEISRFASMDASMTGKGAEAVFRDKEGRRIKKEDLLKAQEEEKPMEKKLEWGKGLAQKREAEARVQELELEKEKPFARTRDDPDLDKMLKERVRWGDPMAHLVKRSADSVLEDLGADEKMKESGFIIPQTIPSHSWIKRGIDFLPNRYGIRPGRHWDGVDRSNGYEKELFKRQSEKRATETEAYLWSVSDM